MAADDELINIADELRKLASETSSLGKLMADAGRSLTDLTSSTAKAISSQNAKINELQKEQGLLNELKNSLKQEISSRASEINSAQSAVQKKQDLIKGYQSEIDGIQSQIASRDMTVQEERTLQAMIDRYSEKINDTASKMVPLQRELDELVDAQQGVIQEFKDVSDALDGSEKDIEKLETQKLQLAFNAVTNAVSIVTKTLIGFTGIVRNTQKQFGITAGQAANLKLTQLAESISSTAKTILSLGKSAAVSTAEIQAAQIAFQEEFGGVISSGAGRELAEQAKEMGISVSQMALARRAFLTTTLGDVGSAIDQQERAIASFEEKGLTAKDAMAFIGQNAELVARAGTRFQDSLMKAAAVAKKIGVDLNKVNQVGDNIIGNFEGFLEGMAELGAMGFGFDATRLAEIAETGDTGALFNELRSQLAATGKDITQLRRSEQLALSETFGMDIAEFQRMAGIEVAGGGESMEDLQKDSNSFLERLVNVFGAAGFIGSLNLLQSKLLRDISKKLGTNLVGGFRGLIRQLRTGGVRGVVGGAAQRARGVVGGVAQGIRGMGPMARVGAGLGLGAAGAVGQFAGAALKERGMEKTGSVVGTLGTAAQFAGIGLMFGPVGAAIGGLVGLIIGITQNLDGWKEIIVAGKETLSSAFTMLIDGIKKIATFFFEYNPVTSIINLAKSVFGGGTTGDDVVSKPGYGDRKLVTQQGVISLNNDDNVVAYADDMISREAAGVTMLSKGSLTKEQPVNNINVDLSKLEAKLDNVVRAIGSMKVNMDGNLVGNILVGSEQRVATSGIFKAQRVTD